jgi:hypothetical protein
MQTSLIKFVSIDRFLLFKSRIKVYVEFWASLSNYSVNHRQPIKLQSILAVIYLFTIYLIVQITI